MELETHVSDVKSLSCGRDTPKSLSCVEEEKKRLYSKLGLGLDEEGPGIRPQRPQHTQHSGWTILNLHVV